MAKSNLSGISVTGSGANTSGLSFARMTSSSPPVASASLGVDVVGNVVVNAMPSYRSVLVTNVANPASSTADQAALSATVPANTFQVGSMVHLQIMGNVMGTGAATYNFWVKLGGTKILAVPFSIALLSTTNGQFGFRSYLTCRTTGSSGAFSTYLQVLTDAQGTFNSATGTQSIDTTQAQTLTCGFNWSNAGTNNIITATQGVILPI